ncbi:CHRD domain-containing protein [Pseudarthrobacter albicanus]|uniref:CHRD domain-containing protein n=1 Tax=Pseudarthrobacter albicanus TaxID=2823873 RepID=UPI001BABE9E2|nr:CHRD domain-containing protein [Pseudarthrobacter albicanus]
MKKSAFLIAPALALGALALSTSPALAADTTTYQANLAAINGSNASGTVMITLNGDQATVTEKVSGLAATFSGKPYPHVQHIHIGAKGTCPDMSADTDKDGVISTTEGAPSYGPIGTTLSTSGDTSPAAGTDLTLAGMGASYTYQRTFALDAKTSASLKAGTAVVVVHGLDPATLSEAAQKAPSDLVPSLPLAATSPALCGTLTAMPAGAPGTGITTPATPAGPDLGLLAVGGGLVLAAGGAYAVRRRMTVKA